MTSFYRCIYIQPRFTRSNKSLRFISSLVAPHNLASVFFLNSVYKPIF